MVDNKNINMISMFSLNFGNNLPFNMRHDQLDEPNKPAEQLAEEQALAEDGAVSDSEENAECAPCAWRPVLRRIFCVGLVALLIRFWCRRERPENTSIE